MWPSNFFVCLNEKEKLAKMPTMTKELLEKRMAAVRTGGRGTVRRTVKAVHKNSSADDKKVSGVLKKLGVSPIAEIDEAFFFRTDGSAYIFKNPKVQASMQSQCFVVSGNYDTKPLAELLPDLLKMGAPTAEAQ